MTKTGLNDRSCLIRGDCMITQDLCNGSIQIIYLTSTDTKPTNIGNGSKAIETDTGKEFIFDAENVVWYDFGYMRVII